MAITSDCARWPTAWNLAGSGLSCTSNCARWFATRHLGRCAGANAYAADLHPSRSRSAGSSITSDCASAADARTSDCDSPRFARAGEAGTSNRHPAANGTSASDCHSTRCGIAGCSGASDCHPARTARGHRPDRLEDGVVTIDRLGSRRHSDRAGADAGQGLIVRTHAVPADRVPALLSASSLPLGAEGAQMWNFKKLTLRREFSHAVRREALIRASFRCQECGTRERLEYHHVGYRGDRSAFNCAVLCVECHRRADAEKRNWSRRR